MATSRRSVGTSVAPFIAAALKSFKTRDGPDLVEFGQFFRRRIPGGIGLEHIRIELRIAFKTPAAISSDSDFDADAQWRDTSNRGVEASEVDAHCESLERHPH